jgi:tRNA(fMet)-specific endonuclease VapC
MAGRFLPDTNVVIALLAGEAAVLQRFSEADEVFASGVVLGELYYGARNSARAAENVARVDAFAAVNWVLACDADTARQYGVLKADLCAKGRMIPENDLWIAATAFATRVDACDAGRTFQRSRGVADRRLVRRSGSRLIRYSGRPARCPVRWVS